MALKKITGKDIREAVDWLWEHKEEGGCIHHVLGTTDDGTKLCFVVGWANGRDYGDDDKKYGYFDDGYCISAKIGYQHRNNAMQSDYEWDFNMPYDTETGDVWDTSSYVPRDADWEREAADYNKEAQKIWDTYGTPGKDGTTALDLMESKKSESAKGSMRRKQESLAKKNEDASLDGVVQKVSEGLDTIQKRLESSVNDKEMSDGYWLHLDFDGVLDSRVTGVTDSSHYDVADYEWEPDEKQEIPCRIYRLSVDPGIYDDDGKFVNDNNMSPISYDICVEVAPDGEDITLNILKSENKFGSKSSTITRSLSFSCDSDGVSDMVDSVVDRVMNDLGNYDYLG